MRKWKALTLVLVVCLLVFIFGATALERIPKPTRTPKPTSTPMPTLAPSRDVWPDLPPLTLDGYLVPDGGIDEFVHVDTENGLWIYISDGLHIQIQRFNDPNLPLIWYEADIRTTGKDRLMSVPADAERPYTQMDKPENIAKANRLVFAINDDQFVQRKIKKNVIGIILRDGVIVNDKTLRSGGNGFPNLETMALFPDGSIRVYQSQELSAQEYVEMGATDVFSFGPILIRDGVINEKLYKLYASKQPRCSIGMIEPCHYVCVVVEGRHAGTSGASILWVAQKLHSLGAVQAFNLDGGNTAALTFMGEKINSNHRGGPDSNIRSIGGMLAIGTSEKVPEK